MKVIIYDLDSQYEEALKGKCDNTIHADGKYAPCRGCFHCWTKHPAQCFMKDKLQTASRVIGRADELIIVTQNLYGSYSEKIKNVLDRSIATSTPLSTYRGGQMHHTLRYGKHKLLKVLVYGDITDGEKQTFTYMAERNAVNDGYESSEVVFLNDLEELESVI